MGVPLDAYSVLQAAHAVFPTFITLWQIYKDSDVPRFVWKIARICQSMLASSNTERDRHKCLPESTHSSGYAAGSLYSRYHGAPSGDGQTVRARGVIRGFTRNVSCLSGRTTDDGENSGGDT